MGIDSIFGYRPNEPAPIDSPNDFRAFDGTVVERGGIDDSGVISGSDTSGCTANGQAETDFPEFNLYRITLEFTGCGSNGAQGTYAGMAALLDWPNDESLFFFVVGEDESELVFLSLPVT